MANETTTYRPSSWVRVAIGVTWLVFVAITIIAIQTGLKPIYVAISIGMAIFAAMGVVESFISRVDIEPNVILIKGLFRTERVAFSDIEKVSAEGGRTAVYVKPGKWKKMPEWVGSNMSARRRIADRLKH